LARLPAIEDGDNIAVALDDAPPGGCIRDSVPSTTASPPRPAKIANNRLNGNCSAHPKTPIAST
jgi:hypothetical protein